MTESSVFETIDLAADLTAAYMEYARETITDRALPDVRDGLKPSQRRILYAMRELSLLHNRPHRKCARVVGDVLGKFHPHGDQAVYLTLVRMGQDWVMNVPLVDGQGNWGCFTGDTKVKLLDGTDRTFEELAQTYSPDEVFYVYSIDESGNVVVGEGRHSRVTRKHVEVVELELDNGEVIRCTPDHLFMLRDGSYKPAKNLTASDSLMPGYFTTAPVREDLNDYLMILNPATETYEFVHHLADQYNEKKGNAALSKGPFVRHHVDFDRWNNNPTNIKRMRFMKHLRLHAEQAQHLWEHPDFRRRQKKGVQRYYQEHPEALELRQCWTQEDHKHKVMRSKILRYGSYLLSRFKASEITPKLYNRMRYNNCFPRFAKAMTYFDSFQELLTLSANYNHRVVAKRFLTERFDVYDITVEPYHNFLLSSGVFAHNSVDGDSPAQMRYTEVRLSAAAEAMLADINMDTVSWQDNFDNSLQEPTVLPGMLPNLLINGSTGIAVGMSTNMPPHNLGEICDAVIHVARKWRSRNKITVDELMKIVPGPDLPTGGIIYRYRDEGNDEGTVDTIRQAYETGRGRIVMQSRVEIEQIGGGKANLVVTALPYAVYKSTVAEKIAKEVRNSRISGVTDLRDESDHSGMRLVVEVSRQANPQDVLAQVLKYSQLRQTFGVINLALVPDGNGGTRPAYLSLKDLLLHFVSHRLNVITRRSRYELEKKEARLHIVEGLLKALDILDQVISTIRRSRTVDTARNNLMSKFKFTEVQAQAILDMPLRRLTALERNALANEAKDLRARIRFLRALLASQKKRLEVVIEETTTLKEKYATPRRTIIVEHEEAGAGTITTAADLVMPEQPQMLVLTTDQVKRVDAEGFSYRGSRTLTKGAVRDVHLAHVAVDPDAEVLLLTNRGRGWKGPVGFVPAEGTPKALGLERGEEVVGIAVLEPDSFLVLGTKQGKVKRTKTEDISLLDRQWGPVVGLAEGDELLFADMAGPGAHILFYTTQGQLLRIDGDTINPQQTATARGVAGISLKKGDQILGGAVVADAAKQEDKWQVVVVTTAGYAHRAALSEYSVKGRGTQGVRCLRPSQRGGTVADVAIERSGTVDVYLQDGRRQRLDLKEIPQTARDAVGNKLVKPPKGSSVDRVVILP